MASIASPYPPTVFDQTQVIGNLRQAPVIDPQRRTGSAFRRDRSPFRVSLFADPQGGCARHALRRVKGCDRRTDADGTSAGQLGVEEPAVRWGSSRDTLSARGNSYDWERIAGADGLRPEPSTGINEASDENDDRGDIQREVER